MSIKTLIIYSLGILTIYACKQEKTIQQTEVSFKKEGELIFYKTKTDTSKITLDIEIADTDFEIQTGLMYRDSMKKNQGMLFVFNDVSERYFYMKNTRFPLDLIYINENNTIVSFQKNAKPFNESSLPSKFPAKYTLEINSGLVDAWKLSVGDSISYILNR